MSPLWQACIICCGIVFLCKFEVYGSGSVSLTTLWSPRWSLGDSAHQLLVNCGLWGLIPSPRAQGAQLVTRGAMTLSTRVTWLNVTKQNSHKTLVLKPWPMGLPFSYRWTLDVDYLWFRFGLHSTRHQTRYQSKSKQGEVYPLSCCPLTSPFTNSINFPHPI